MDGFFNSLLRVDLTNQTYRTEEISDQVLQTYLGGKGLATYLMLEEIKSEVDPLSSENKLIFATGSASDTKIPGSAKYGVFSKSPLTGIYGESYSGGRLAPQLSRTGYDAIIFEGVSKAPVFLEISDQEVKFHEASHLWSKDTYATEDSVLKEVGIPQAQAVVIGPAGENLVRLACLENNYWCSAGRCGLGAVMGSKKLKAIVFHGKKKRKVAHEEILRSYIKDFVAKAKDNSGVLAYRELGTPMLVAITNAAGAFPTRYWSKGFFEDWEKISADTLLRDLEVKPRACAHCFIACRRFSRVKKGRHKGLVIDGPDYETIYAFGGLCMINSLEEIAYLNDLCDRLGMDTISTGNLVAFTMEASQRGALDYRLNYGDAEGAAELVQAIAQREGLGAILAEGIRSASRQLKLEDLAIHVKGLEPAGYDPRVLKGMALAYGTSDRGACHLRATVYKPELAGMVDPGTVEGKAELLVDYEDRHTLFDTLILCRFFRDLVSWEDLSTIYRMTTGLELDKKDLKKICSNIMDATRRFNLREGVTREDDLLPSRLFRESLGEGEAIKREDCERMLGEYYQLRGWDQEGRPRELAI
ncbi:aldehyde ferredoxin oxidoreductase family protein [Candidatus Hakubella thermalkaliphila]|uniref:Aldehyde:ferredoxin oxidoreductase n=1 Tax=Candidatus Hakubella thermalkaliphila TaxID=2754717 RepID=A0A6V8QA41_9ACTN|nr:aldehyde ferredoxin oxidoreductase family protein [Candidatus Hakubella thermalkaliphila]GFP40286.1 aldehyde:ferredoxin oxidoreductase [Candidatus Hakubella thermalkaliphila]GFP42606.1 aldehyde:ferredoxin oxidoreductase [Candidatus Hakubella thermalkaliphila]